MLSTFSYSLVSSNRLRSICASVLPNSSQRQSANELTAAISRYLHLPQSEIQNLLNQNASYLKLVERFRNQRQSQIALNRHLESFEIIDEKEFLDFQSTILGSKLLVSFHFGDFVYGNNLIAAKECSSRNQYFFTQLKSSDAFLSNMRLAFGQSFKERPQQLTIESTGAVGLVKRLKQSNTSLLTFIDLPKGFGERVKVQFLGRDAWFPRGPATLALLAKVPILPILNFTDGNKNYINVFPQLYPAAYSKSSRHGSAQEITQQLVSYLERAITLYPWQWRFFSALPSFFTPGQD